VQGFSTLGIDLPLNKFHGFFGGHACPAAAANEFNGQYSIPYEKYARLIREVSSSHVEDESSHAISDITGTIDLQNKVNLLRCKSQRRSNVNSDQRPGTIC
jgi:hypothetical protein